MAEDLNVTTITLNVVNVGTEADEQDTYQFINTLMRVLKNMDVESVALLSEQDSLSLPGAKGELLKGLFITILPTALPKIMEFLQSLVLQKENHVIRAKVQNGDKSAEIEYPANMSSIELKNHIEVIRQMIDA